MRVCVCVKISTDTFIHRYVDGRGIARQYYKNLVLRSRFTASPRMRTKRTNLIQPHRTTRRKYTQNVDPTYEDLDSEAENNTPVIQDV